jgi:predicted metal-dependent hydrolase
VSRGLLREAVEAWYRQEAHRVISEKAQALAAQYGVGFGRISIRAQKARWGSCSSRRNLSFNWRLILAPPEILDYIVIHELTHLTEMSHSRRFWTLLGARCPDYRQHESWLKKNGATLGF